MKAVAAALVLIAGAAVVLWYSNTLNSWVLGGLIGGLAALLLSIPISLLLFSYLSRRHDERLRAEVSRVRLYDSQEASPRRTRRVYDAHGYALPDGQSLSDEEIYERYYQQRDNRHGQTAHHLPVSSSQRFPVQNQLQLAQRGMHTPVVRPSTRQLPDDASSVEQKDPTTKRTTRRINYPGFPGYKPDYSKQRSEALRAARREAAQHHDDDVDVLPTHFSRPLPPARRLSQSLASQTDRLQPQRVDEEAKSHHRTRSRRVGNAAPSQDDLSYSLFSSGGSTAHSEPAFSTEPQTEYWNIDNYPQTGPMHQLPQTDQLHTQGQSVGEPSLDVTTGNVTRPLVRRAPYLYNDDSLREELVQQINKPVVRRSSRLEVHQQRELDDDI